MSDGNYRKLRKNKIIKDASHAEFYAVDIRIDEKKNKIKKSVKLISILIVVGVISTFTFYHFNESVPTLTHRNKGATKDIHQENRKIISGKVVSINTSNTANHNGWKIETPSEILHIEKLNNSKKGHQSYGPSSANLKNKINNHILILRNQVHQKRKLLSNNIAPIDNVKVNIQKKVATKKQQSFLNKKVKLKPKYKSNYIIKQKKVVIAPESHIHNGIFVIPPNVHPTAGGWKITEIYKKYAIITDNIGKSYTVHAGSFVNGHEVLRVSKNKVYLTGNILINR